jgi:hypothetical protein
MEESHLGGICAKGFLSIENLLEDRNNFVHILYGLKLVVVHNLNYLVNNMIVPCAGIEPAPAPLQGY